MSKKARRSPKSVATAATRAKAVAPGMRLIREWNGSAMATIEVGTLARAHHWSEELRTGVASSVGDLVTRHGVDQGDVSRSLPLAFLAPDIVEAILQGRQPVELTALRLKRIGLPLSWVEQRRLLGFES